MDTLKRIVLVIGYIPVVLISVCLTLLMIVLVIAAAFVSCFEWIFRGKSDIMGYIDANAPLPSKFCGSIVDAFTKKMINKEVGRYYW